MAVEAPSPRRVDAKAASRRPFADAALTAAVRFWFVVTVAGQLLFAASIASFYGLTAARGDLRAWDGRFSHGYSSGDGLGKTAIVVHLVSAVIIILSGAVQIVPGIRARAPRFHRWNGRLYMGTALTVSLAGLYLLWVRGTLIGSFLSHLGQSLDAILILVCGALALRFAIARDFARHRRWALRLYLVVSASLFIRAAAPLLGIGGLGQDATVDVLSFAQTLVPLAILELYFLAKDRGGSLGRLAMAGGLGAVTIALAAGTLFVSSASWVPSVKRGFDPRPSIASVLSETIDSSGIDAAAAQYHDLRGSARYNFDERELNDLGYQLLRAKKLPEAIGIFRLNVEAYPLAANTWDSLAEAYMDAGDTAQAIADYRKSLDLNPKNENAARMLERLAELMR
jgi:hypothetical protein